MPEPDDKTRLISLEKLEPVAMIRFWQMLETGQGDYSQDRHEWLDAQSVDEVVERIRQKEAIVPVRGVQLAWRIE